MMNVSLSCIPNTNFFHPNKFISTLTKLQMTIIIVVAAIFAVLAIIAIRLYQTKENSPVVPNKLVSPSLEAENPRPKILSDPDKAENKNESSPHPIQIIKKKKNKNKSPQTPIGSKVNKTIQVQPDLIKSIPNASFDYKNKDTPLDHVFCKKDWNKWGNIGDVPPLPIEAYQPCPVRNKGKIDNGQRMIDNFIFIWIPPTVDGNQLTVNNIEKIANSDKFGDLKIKFDISYNQIRSHKDVNKEVKKGYWAALLPIIKKNENDDETRKLSHKSRKEYIEKNYSKEYGLPTAREALIYSLMPYFRNGTIMLGINPYLFAACEEILDNGLPVVVGAHSKNSLYLLHPDSDQPGKNSNTCVVLTRRFYPA